MSPTPPPVPFTVWLIEDNEAYRSTASRLILRMSEVLGTRGFKSCEAAIKALDNTSLSEHPDIVLLDIGLPGMSGLDGLPEIKRRAPSAQVLVLTVFEDEQKVFRALCAGADGYLLKSSTLEHIREALLEARAGGSPMNGRIARLVLREFAKQTPPHRDYGLTDREREILQLLVEGLVKKEIAARLDISFHTVDMHLRHIYEKLRVNTATGAVAKALREKLV